MSLIQNSGSKLFFDAQWARSVFRRLCTSPPPPPHVSGLLLLCSAIFQDCGAGVLTKHREAQK